MRGGGAQIRAVILDLDGVIYRGRTPIPGAKETADWLARNGYGPYYLTNNSTQTREYYAEMLAGFGIQADADHIVTSASLTARVGVRVVRRRGKRPIHYVVVGMDRRFTYRKLHEAQQAVLAGAELIATNRDATYPVEGNVIPGGGSIVAAVATACEREPILIGKPSARAGEAVARLAGVRPEEALMVGDRLETDILAGTRAGLRTCLVLTGISSEEEARAAPEEMQPDFILPSIADLPKLLGSPGSRGGRGR